MASAGGETNDKVAPRYGGEGNRRILQYRADKLGARLAGTGTAGFLSHEIFFKTRMKYFPSVQAVVCCRSINWTAEASEAIR